MTVEESALKTGARAQLTGISLCFERVQPRGVRRLGGSPLGSKALGESDERSGMKRARAGGSAHLFGCPALFHGGAAS
eukprot:scaffold17782_cov113-Isochrysis_galbana.AAC.7